MLRAGVCRPTHTSFLRLLRSLTAGTTLAKHPGMFRVDIATCPPRVYIVCQGHLDADAVAAIERGRAVAETTGLDVVIRVCRGATADRPVVARLAGYPAERLEVDSPFLRSWLEELRAVLARAGEFGSKEPTSSGSDRQ